VNSERADDVVVAGGNKRPLGYVVRRVAERVNEPSLARRAERKGYDLGDGAYVSIVPPANDEVLDGSIHAPRLPALAQFCDEARPKLG
jgi:hypothetical protein